MHYRAILASPLGFLIGLSLGALGGGGSILAVPALVYAAGQDPKSATTTSLLLVGMASLVGMFGHHRAGRVRLGIGIVLGVAGIGGSLLGSAINRGVNPDLLLLGFAGLVCVAAWRMLVGCPTCTKAGETKELTASTDPTRGSGGGTATLVRARVDLRLIATVIIAGTVVGFLTGLFGIGGGFVIVPALTLGLKMPMPEAIGTSLLVIVINSIVALSARVTTTHIDWAVTVPFTVAAIGGVLAGSRVADRLEPEKSLRWFAVLLVLVALYTGARAGTAFLT